MIRKWEGETSLPGGDALQRIGGTGVNLHWLLTGEGSMRSDEERAATPDVAPEGSRFVSSAHSQGRPPDGLAVGIGPDMPLRPDEEGGKENPLTTRYVERWVKIIKMVEDLPDAEAMMLLEETFARAQNAKQIDELKRTVAELRAAQQKTG